MLRRESKVQELTDSNVIMLTDSNELGNLCHVKETS